MLTINHVLTALTGTQHQLPPLAISEGCIDSRQATRGSLFVALRGEHTDGHKFVGDAFRNGAAAALIDQRLPDLNLVDVSAQVSLSVFSSRMR